MSKYYFNLRESGALNPDPEGVEIGSPDALRSMAIEGLRSVIADDVLSGRLSLASQIEVMNETGGLVLTIGFADAVGQA